MSRLIVKNIPKQISETELKSHFEKHGGQITDCRVMFKEKKNRRIAFIGYKSDSDALKAKEYFNNTYIYMSRINVDFAKTNDDPTLPRAWSKYSKNSSVYLEKHPEDKQKMKKTKGEDQKDGKAEQPINKEKKAKFEEFLHLMRKTQNPSITETMPGVELKEDKKKKKKVIKNLTNVNGNQVIVTELDENNLKAGVSNKRVHIKLSAEPAKKEISNIISKEQNRKNENEKAKVSNEIKEKMEEKQLNEKRLYVINLPFNSTEEEIREVFLKYGKITELKLPKGKEGKFKGFAYVAYENESQALHAFADLDNKIVMGRILHVRPAYADDQNKKILEPIDPNNILADEKTSFKKSKKKEMLEKVNDKTNWNALFLNPNSVLASISAQYNMKKREILSMDSSDQAVRIAMAETQIINETKDWLESQGVNLWFLEENREECLRSDKIILIKNIAYECKESELRELFEFYGVISKFIMSPNRSIGIVEFESEQFAANSFKNLSYYKFKGEPLYLEWAPIDILKKEDLEEVEENKEIILEINNDSGEKILYIKNLSFKSSEEGLLKLFKEKFDNNEIVSVKIIKKNGLSQGYGFIEFKSHEFALKALKLYQNSLFDDHILKLSVSKQSNKEKQKSLKRKRENFEPNNKIVVRNIAFEATSEDIKELFKTYGDIKMVRLPKKMNKQHRGFAFVEFVSVEEANNAFNSLQNTHLYGRKLVLEWAEEGGNKKLEI